MTKDKNIKTGRTGFIRGMAVALAICVAIWLGYRNSGYYIPDSSKGSLLNKIHASAVVEDEKNLLTSEQKNLLKSFADKYANTLCMLQTQDLSLLYYEKSEDYYKNIAAYETLVSIRAMSDKNLAAENAQITYNVEDVVKKGTAVTVHITEDNVQKFRHLSEPSCSYNLNHVFVLEETGGKWYIKSHEQAEDFFLLALEAWEDAHGEDYAETAQNTVKILATDAQENIDELKISTGDQPIEIKVADTTYDRDAAVSYAKEWCDERNYNGRWLAYDMYGGNCQNFASQCIYAGGIEMDYKGYPECQWKFYSQEQNNNQTPGGRSYSWTGVDPFYTYAVNNRSTGLICQADLALEYAEKGDVIQVGSYHEWRHSLVVTDVIYSEDGNLEDIVVASNTADRWNYPLSAYIYTYPRLIHILGQN